MNHEVFDRILGTRNAVFDPADGCVTAVNYDKISDSRKSYAGFLPQVMLLLKNRGKSGPAFANMLAWSYWNWIPEYFFSAPASSTGKYHPAAMNKPGGLVLHSLAAARFADSLLELAPDLDDPRTRNRIIVAAWLHDIFKYGNPYAYDSKCYVKHEHPLYAADFLVYGPVTETLAELGVTHEDCVEISGMIRSHSGPYTTSKYSNVVLPEPETLSQKIVYKADYFASLKECGIVADIIGR